MAKNLRNSGSNIGEVISPDFYPDNTPAARWLSRLSGNNFRRQFNMILRRAGVKKGTFHDFRRTAISMWFANGMSEHDVMVLAGHASFTTTHKFYLAISDDLIPRARAATVQGLRQKLVLIGADAF